MWPTSSAIGAVLQDRYRLDSLLGTGASARVFLAYDLELHREVAIKLLHPGLANDSGFLPRFRSEARAAAALNHPNVVQIYDWGQDDAGGFLVLEYLSGGSLRDLLDRGIVLSHAQVARIGAQAASALAFAHSKGIVHRDVKPANLLFDQAGNVHVADFGLARAMVDASWTEPIGVVFGTARYASPEQARGLNIDDRSDVYSLALVCYEALTGAPPFEADTPLATLMARLNAPLPDLPALGALAPALVAATTDDPKLRLDASGFANALSAVAANSTQASIPIAALHKAQVPGAPEFYDDDATAAFNLSPTEDISALKSELLPGAPTPVVQSPVVETKRRRRRRGSLIAGSVVLILVIAGVAALLIVRFGIYNNTVPSVARLASADATSKLRHAGLRIGAVAESFSPSVASGEVISQSVRPGTRVSNGTIIDLVVSKGHAPELVPKTVGLSLSAATVALEKEAFVVKKSLVYNETVAPNVVVSAAPSSGSAPYDSTVVLEVSRGPHPRTIPNVSGMSVKQARSTLETLRLLPKNARAYSNTVSNGIVISSDPASGTSGIPVGATVQIIVSRGPQLVAVPAVAGMPIADAISALQASGLVVSEQVGPPFAHVATTTDPAPGTMVPPGTDVTLYAA